MSDVLASFLEQRFATVPVSIAGQGVALYGLSVRAPGDAAPPVPGLTFVFPMSPQAIHKETPEINTLYDVQGPPSTFGVKRLGDMWGEAPPTYTIRGTTGWKRHSTDGFVNAGKQAITVIQDLLSRFAQLNQQQMYQQAAVFYTLEFYDYWMNEFWEVLPVGPQVFEQSADKPILTYYNFRFACIRSVAAPIPPLVVDAIEALFSAGAQAATSVFNTSMALAVTNYG